MKTDFSIPALLSASALKGAPVKNLEGEDLGKIEDLIFDPANGQVAYAVLSFGGILSVGDRQYAIPWDMLYLDTRNEVLLPYIDKQMLENAPRLENAPDNNDRWPDANERVGLLDIYSDYKYRPY